MAPVPEGRCSLGRGRPQPGCPRDSPRGWGGWERVWDGTGSMESPWRGFPGSRSLPGPQRPSAVTGAVCHRGRIGGSGVGAGMRWHGDSGRGKPREGGERPAPAPGRVG